MPIHLKYAELLGKAQLCDETQHISILQYLNINSIYQTSE